MSTAERTDVLVIGGGAMGSAAAWRLAARGRQVVLLERFAPGHVMGSSHGESRNFNTDYDRQPYLDLLVEAGRLWRELEDESGTHLLETTGVVNHGGIPDFDRAEVQRAAGIPAEVVPAAEAGERWPGIRFATDVLFHPEAGRLDADAAVSALQRAAAARGAVVRHETPAEALDVRADRVLATTADGTISADVAVVAVGAWTAKLLGDSLPLPPLRVTQEQPAYFAPRLTGVAWPGFNHAPRPEGDEWWPAAIYGMDTPGFGVKAGWHGAGPVTDPDARTFTPEPAQLLALQRYVREWLPGADPDAVAPISCTYTTTRDHDFVIDRRGRVVVAAGFSGHGFKFTPSVGELLARLAVGEVEAAPEAFRLDR